MERLKHGAFKLLTPEQQLEHIHMLARRYRVNHRELLSKKYKAWHKNRMITKPCVCVCRICGQKFNAPRKCYKRCENCHENTHVEAENKRKLARQKRADYRQMIQQILELAKQGMRQEDIASHFNYTQSGISSICRKYGLSRQAPRKKGRKCSN